MDPFTIGLLALGAGASAGGSYLAAKNKGKWQYDPYGQLNPEQKSVMQATGPKITGMINAGPDYYKGQLTAPWTSGEQANLDLWRKYQKEAYSGLSPLLQGKFDEDYWQKALVNPLTKTWNEQTLPSIEEQYAGPSNTYWGGARANAVARSQQDLQDTLAAKRAELAHEAMFAPIQAAPIAAQMATTGAQMEELPRLVEQYDLTAKYNEWIRGNESYRSLINSAINFLGVGSVSAQYQEAPPNPWAYALSGLGSAASMYGMTSALNPAAAATTASGAGMVPGQYAAMGASNPAFQAPANYYLNQGTSFANSMLPATAAGAFSSGNQWLNQFPAGQWNSQSALNALYPYGTPNMGSASYLNAAPFTYGGGTNANLEAILRQLQYQNMYTGGR